MCQELPFPALSGLGGSVNPALFLSDLNLEGSKRTINLSKVVCSEDLDGGFIKLEVGKWQQAYDQQQ